MIVTDVNTFQEVFNSLIIFCGNFEMDISISKIESSKQKQVIIVDGHKFRKGLKRKMEEISWRCTVKSCAAKICTDDACSVVVSGNKCTKIRVANKARKWKATAIFRKDHQKSHVLNIARSQKIT